MKNTGYLNWLKNSKNKTGISKTLENIAFKYCLNERPEKKESKLRKENARARIPKEVILGIRAAAEFGRLRACDIAKAANLDANWVGRVMEYSTRASLTPTKEDLKHWEQIKTPLDPED